MAAPQFTVLKVVLQKTECLPISGQVDSIAVIVKPETTGADIFSAVVQKIRKTFGADNFKPEHLKPFKLYFRRVPKEEPRRLSSDELVWDLLKSHPTCQIVFTPKTLNRTIRKSVTSVRMIKALKSSRPSADDDAPADDSLLPRSSSRSATIHGASLSASLARPESPARALASSPRAAQPTSHPASKTLGDLRLGGGVESPRSEPKAAEVPILDSAKSLDAISKAETKGDTTSHVTFSLSLSNVTSNPNSTLNSNSNSTLNSVSPTHPSHESMHESHTHQNLHESNSNSNLVTHSSSSSSISSSSSEDISLHPSTSKPDVLDDILNKWAQKEGVSPAQVRKVMIGNKAPLVNLEPMRRMARSPRPASAMLPSPRSPGALPPFADSLAAMESPPPSPKQLPAESRGSPRPSHLALEDDSEDSEDEEDYLDHESFDIFAQLLSAYTQVRASLKPVHTVDKSSPVLEPVRIKRIASRPQLLHQLKSPVSLKPVSNSNIKNEVQIILPSHVDEVQESSPPTDIPDSESNASSSSTTSSSTFILHPVSSSSSTSSSSPTSTSSPTPTSSSSSFPSSSSSSSSFPSSSSIGTFPLSSMHDDHLEPVQCSSSTDLSSTSMSNDDGVSSSSGDPMQQKELPQVRIADLLQGLMAYQENQKIPDAIWFAEIRKILEAQERIEQANISVQTKRINIIKEIDSVEKNYVQSLRIVVTYFQKPLEDDKIITAAQSEILFSSIRAILEDHEKFYSLLKRNLTTHHLGEIFAKLEQSLGGYAQYMSNYSRAAQLIQTLQTSEPFQAFMKRPHLKKKIGTFTLLDYLIRPVQQVPRYSMLLSQLQGVTPLDHDDYNPLCSALTKVRDIANSLNEASSRSENEIAMKSIQEKIAQGHSRMRQAGLIQLSAVPDRFFTFEGDILWPTHSNRKKTKWMLLHCFLFSDVLIGASIKEVSSGEDASGADNPPQVIYKFKLAYPLNQVQILSRSTIAKPMPDKIFPNATWTGEWLNLKISEYSPEHLSSPSKTRLLALITKDAKENRQWRHFLQIALTRIASQQPLTLSEINKNRTILNSNAF